MKREELMWTQKARSEWILKGDKIQGIFKLLLNKGGLEVESIALRMLRWFL